MILRQGFLQFNAPAAQRVIATSNCGVVTHDSALKPRNYSYSSGLIVSESMLVLSYQW